MNSFNGYEYRCTSEITLQLISGKWKILILSLLQDGPQRFSELQRLMPDTTQKMLTAQLRELERDQLIKRRVYAVAPPKVDYFLTEMGQQLVPIVKSLCQFGHDYVNVIR